MADWTSPLPSTAVEGADTHVQDHNKLTDAVKEIRSNVDGIELTPGPEGPQGPAGADGADSSVPGPEGPEGPEGPAGADGADGFGTEAQYDDIIARLEALETPEA